MLTGYLPIMTADSNSRGFEAELLGHRLLQLGVLLFLFGFIVGFLIPVLASPRMALSSHLEGVFNGILLVVTGLMWPRLRLSLRMRKWLFGFAVYGTFANLAATFLAAVWGAGASMMPMASEGALGSGLQEGVITGMLVTLSVAMVAVCVLLLFGLRGGARQYPTADPAGGARSDPTANRAGGVRGR